MTETYSWRPLNSRFPEQREAGRGKEGHEESEEGLVWAQEGGEAPAGRQATGLWTYMAGTSQTMSHGRISEETVANDGRRVTT